MLSPCSSSPPGRSIVHLAALACMGLCVCAAVCIAAEARPGQARQGEEEEEERAQDDDTTMVMMTGNLNSGSAVLVLSSVF